VRSTAASTRAKSKRAFVAMHATPPTLIKAGELDEGRKRYRRRRKAGELAYLSRCVALANLARRSFGLFRLAGTW
jgi:hypothetical protein